jgi:hypothetical protein
MSNPSCTKQNQLDSSGPRPFCEEGHSRLERKQGWQKAGQGPSRSGRVHCRGLPALPEGPLQALRSGQVRSGQVSCRRRRRSAASSCGQPGPRCRRGSGQSGAGSAAAGPGPHGLDGTHMHSTQAPARAHRCVCGSGRASVGVCQCVGDAGRVCAHACVCVRLTARTFICSLEYADCYD